MTQPPYGPESERPQDRPQDVTRPFPTYGRPQRQPPPQQPPAQQPGTQQPGAQQPGTQQPGTQWAAPGQPQLPPPPPSYGPGYAPQQYPPAYGQPPAPYAYGYGYPGQTGGTNGLATASLATGLGGLIFGLAAPVAIGLGIAALVQIKKRQDSGKGMAIAGLIIGAVTIVGYVVLFGVLFAIGSSVSHDDYGSPQPVSSYSGPTTYVEDLAVGECFDDGNQDGEAVRQPCSDPHDGEIIADVTLADGPYPGDNGVDHAADQRCSPEFGTYVGKPAVKSELDLVWWTPSRSSWTDHDDRLVVCAAYGPDGDQLTGTVKGTKR